MKRAKSTLLILLSTVLVLTSSCAKKTGVTEVKSSVAIEPMPLSTPIDTISSANNKLALKFIRETIKTNNNMNTVISPLSLSTLMALTANGAEGKTKEEFLNTLELQNITSAVINEDYKKIIANYNSLKNVKLKMGNSIWIDKDLTVKDDFKSIGNQYYEADINNLDFDKSSAVDTINEWVNQRTEGKIDKIVDSFDKDTAMALINTMYFKGEWKNTFLKNNTAKAKFTSSNGQTSEISMMHKQSMMDYYKGTNFEAVRIPYKDENFGMYVFLPNKGVSTEEFLNSFSTNNWNDVNKGFTNIKVNLALPKFKIELEQKLNDMLKGFGLQTAFQSNADFSSISEEQKIRIHLIKQKCFIDVNEDGTEAAAATEEIARYGASNPDDLINFVADRPFVYAIADKNTDMILFVGTVEKP